MFRYLDLLVEEVGRLRIAMTARGHDPRWLWQARPLASAAGTLFVRSYERGERVHAAMLARGFTDRMPTLDHRQTPSRDWLAAVAIPLVSLGAAGAAVVLR
jgi:cobalt/nickel transport system permease protein